MSFAPDGRSLAYDTRRADEAPERDIVVIAIDGSHQGLVVDHPADDFLLGWSAAGSNLLFASDRRGTLDAWTIPVSDGSRQGAAALIVSDLGSEIVPLGSTRDGSFYYSALNRRDDLYMTTLDPRTGQLTAPERVVRDVAPVTAPEWSPDGRSLAYVSRRGRDPQTRFASMVTIRSAETGEERTLSPLSFRPPNIGAGVVSCPRWSPAGRFLLVVGPAGGSLWQVDTETGATEAIATEARGVSTWATDWFPDGMGIVQQRQDESSGDLRRFIFVMRDLDTGEEREFAQYVAVPHPAWGIALSPAGRQLAADGRYLVFGRGRIAPGDERLELWRIAVDGGEPERLGLSMEGSRLLGLSVHPDGQRIAFTAGPTPQQVVRVVTGFQR